MYCKPVNEQVFFLIWVVWKFLGYDIPELFVVFSFNGMSYFVADDVFDEVVGQVYCQGVNGEIVTLAMGGPFCFHFSVEDLVYVGVEFSLVFLDKSVNKGFQLSFGSVLDYCLVLGFSQRPCDSVLLVFYPFLVFLEDLLRVSVVLWEYKG